MIETRGKVHQAILTGSSVLFCLPATSEAFAGEQDAGGQQERVSKFCYRIGARIWLNSCVGALLENPILILLA